MCQKSYMLSDWPSWRNPINLGSFGRPSVPTFLRMSSFFYFFHLSLEIKILVLDKRGIFLFKVCILSCFLRLLHLLLFPYVFLGNSRIITWSSAANLSCSLWVKVKSAKKIIYSVVFISRLQFLIIDIWYKTIWKTQETYETVLFTNERI